jgi:hypothetical protein
MNTLKQRLLTNWSLPRIMRLGIGTMLLVMGIQSRDWAMGLFSVFFLYQAVTDTGCCGSGACYAPPASKNKMTASEGEKEIEYEEIK